MATLKVKPPANVNTLTGTNDVVYVVDAQGFAYIPDTQQTYFESKGWTVVTDVPSVPAYVEVLIDQNNNLVGPNGLINGIIEVTESRDLTQSDNGQTLDCTEPDLTLTVPDDLVNFGCAIINNTTTIAFSGGATGNGATDDIELTAVMGAIQATSTPDAYKVVG